MQEKKSSLTLWLESAPKPLFSLYLIAASFSVYFFMFAFRKPFAAAKYEGLMFFGTNIDLKTALIIGQVLGYGLSKYVGVKYCSEVTRRFRAWAMVLMILIAEAALLLFAVLPMNWKIIAIFLNGFPLGMMWGLVARYLEGRRTTELLIAAMSCSYIIASGIFKDVGLALMANFDISEAWMPVTTGILFLLPFLLAVWFLNQVPAPDQLDEVARVKRKPMNRSERIAFLKLFLPGLILLFIVKFFLNAYREFRDNFGVEIFEQLGCEGKSAIFTRAEFAVAFGVLVILASLSLIKNNRRGVLAVFMIMAGGTVLLGVSSLLFKIGLISGFQWMILVGVGTYLAYVPLGAILFERLIAFTNVIGTVVFAAYLADAIAYTGTISVMLYSELAEADISKLEFFQGMTYFMSALGTVLLLISCIYFLHKSRKPAVS